MELVFKLSSSADPQYPAVKDSNFKTHYGAIHGNMAWITLAPYIRQATRDRVIPFIGQAMYDDIAEKYINDDVLTDAQADFLELLQDAVAYYTIYHALPSQNIVISDMGVQESIGSEGTSVPVGQWRFKSTLWKICEQADRNLDRLLAFMEAQVLDSNAYFDLWKDDPAYTTAVSGVFRMTSELNSIVNIQSSRRTFVAMVPHLLNAERGKLTELICSDMVKELENEVKDNDLSAENAILLPYVQDVVAHWAVYIGVPNMAVVIENDGIKVASSTDGMDAKANAASVFGKEAIPRLQQQAKMNADDAIARMLNFLYDNADDYATWKDSPCYLDPDTVSGSRVGCSEDEVGGVMI